MCSERPKVRFDAHAIAFQLMERGVIATDDALMMLTAVSETMDALGRLSAAGLVVCFGNATPRAAHEDAPTPTYAPANLLEELAKASA